MTLGIWEDTLISFSKENYPKISGIKDEDLREVHRRAQVIGKYVLQKVPLSQLRRYCKDMWSVSSPVAWALLSNEEFSSVAVRCVPSNRDAFDVFQFRYLGTDWKKVHTFSAYTGGEDIRVCHLPFFTASMISKNAKYLPAIVFRIFSEKQTRELDFARLSTAQISNILPVCGPGMGYYTQVMWDNCTIV